MNALQEMNATATAQAPFELSIWPSSEGKRTSRRTEMTGRLTIRLAGNKQEPATWRDLSSRGAGITSARPLEPGSPVMLLTGNDEELKGRVVWCRAEESDWCYAIGLQVYASEPDAEEYVTTMLSGDRWSTMDELWPLAVVTSRD